MLNHRLSEQCVTVLCGVVDGCGAAAETDTVETESCSVPAADLNPEAAELR